MAATGDNLDHEPAAREPIECAPSLDSLRPAGLPSG